MKNYQPYNITPKPDFSIAKLLYAILVISGFAVFSSCSDAPKNAIEKNVVANIFPEYYDLIIPPNIAPLNFIVKEPGSKFRVEIAAKNENPISIQQKSPIIKIPLKQWHNILSGNIGKTLS